MLGGLKECLLLPWKITDKKNTAKAMNITRACLAQIFCFKRGNLDRRIILRNPCKMTVKSLLTSSFRPTLSRFRPTNPWPWPWAGASARSAISSSCCRPKQPAPPPTRLLHLPNPPSFASPALPDPRLLAAPPTRLVGAGMRVRRAAPRWAIDCWW